MKARSTSRKKLIGASCNLTIFEEAAIEAILNAADGTPRLINKYRNAAILLGDSTIPRFNTIGYSKALEACYKAH